MEMSDVGHMSGKVVMADVDRWREERGGNIFPNT